MCFFKGMTVGWTGIGVLGDLLQHGLTFLDSKAVIRLIIFILCYQLLQLQYHFVKNEEMSAGMIEKAIVFLRGYQSKGYFF